MLNWRKFKHVSAAYWRRDEWGGELDSQAMWEDLYDRFGAAPDGTGNIVFDTEEGQLMFLLTYPAQEST